MEVDALAVGVCRIREVALLAGKVFVGISLGLFQPRLTGRCEVILQHPGNVGRVRHIEDRSVLRFCTNPFQNSSSLNAPKMSQILVNKAVYLMITLSSFRVPPRHDDSQEFRLFRNSRT